MAKPAIGHTDQIQPLSTTLQISSIETPGVTDHGLYLCRHTDTNKLWVGATGNPSHIIDADNIEIKAYPIEGGSILVHDDTLTHDQRSTTIAPSQRAVYDHVEAVKSSSLIHKEEFFHKTSTNPATEVHGDSASQLTNPLFDYNVNNYKMVAIWWQWADHMGYEVLPLEALDTQEDNENENWGRLYVRANRDRDRWISFHKNSSGKLVWNSYHGLTNDHWLHIKAWGYR